MSFPSNFKRVSKECTTYFLPLKRLKNRTILSPGSPTHPPRQLLSNKTTAFPRYSQSKDYGQTPNLVTRSCAVRPRRHRATGAVSRKQHVTGLPFPFRTRLEGRTCSRPPWSRSCRFPQARGAQRQRGGGDPTGARPPYLLERRLLSRARAPGAGRSHKRKMVPRTLASHLYIPGLSSSGGRHTPRREPQSCRRRCRLRRFGGSQNQARICDAIRGPTDLTFSGLGADSLEAADVTFFRPTGKRPP